MKNSYGLPDILPENYRMNVSVGPLVRISAYSGFGEWLYGQTIPLALGEDNPYDWAYMHDWVRFMRHVPGID